MWVAPSGGVSPSGPGTPGAEERRGARGAVLGQLGPAPAGGGGRFQRRPPAPAKAVSPKW